MADSKKFQDRMAERYSKCPVPDEVTNRKKPEVTRGHLNPGMEIIVFGCGTTALIHVLFFRHVHASNI